MAQTALLALEDGTLFVGESIGMAGQAVGEVVFNTAMTGYQEILTDPSYARQIVTLTYPHIGNTGVNPEDMEAPNVITSYSIHYTKLYERRVLLDEKQDIDDLMVSGESKLMDFPELGDIQKLRRLFDAFTKKRDLLHLLERSLRAGGVKLFIGSESGYEALEGCSVVTASYNFV